MKAKQFRDMTNNELNTKLVDLKNELFNLRFQLATGQLDNTNKINMVKKDIARVKTVLKEMEFEA
ncbi:MAG: 50S ribosomal protein L29 [Clostridiales bacterium]|nr:50S ribosomal protein L29 [Clostridiales bacterium]